MPLARRYKLLMNCTFCKKKIIGDPTYCKVCFRPTALLTKELSALRMIKDALYDFQWKKQIKLALFLILPVLALFFGLFFLRNFQFFGVMLVLFPILLAPLVPSGNAFQKVFFYVPLSIVNFVYFLVLRLVCSGDPILNLVYLIMSCYWLSICYPVIFLQIQGVSLKKSILFSIKSIKESRWQQFFIIVFVGISNFLALLLTLGIGLIFTIPFSYFLLERYYQKLDKHYIKVLYEYQK